MFCVLSGVEYVNISLKWKKKESLEKNFSVDFSGGEELWQEVLGCREQKHSKNICHFITSPVSA